MGTAFFSELAGEFYSLQLLDALTIGMLAILEGILSVDNALVLAILVRDLPPDQRRKALSYGIVGAFVFRFLALLLAASLMRLLVFKLLGGVYLIYLAMKHMFFFYKEEAHQPSVKTTGSFWKTVAVVELTDVAFSIDSITTAVAMSEKVIVVWAGGILGIISLRFLAGFFVRLLERLPKLEDIAYQLIFFIGIKLSLESFHVKMAHWVFWVMMGVLLVLGAGLVYRDYYQKKSQTKFHNRLVDQLEKGEISPQEVLELEYIPRQVIAYLKHKNCIRIEPLGEKGCEAQGTKATGTKGEAM